MDLVNPHPRHHRLRGGSLLGMLPNFPMSYLAEFTQCYYNQSINPENSP